MEEEMNIKIIAVLGSPGRDGNTCVLARKVLEGAADSGAEIEELFLPDYRIDFCRGCISRNIASHCMATGSCNLKDDVNMLRQRLYNADGIVLASPSYGIMETARMKNFLVDRIGMYTAYTSGLGGKYFAGVSTCGGIGAKKVAKKLADHYVGGFHQRGYMSGYIGVTLANSRVETRPDELEKAYALGKKLVRDIESKRRYIFQHLLKRMINSVIVKKIILQNIYKNKDGSMKAVYADLVERNLIKP
jgi:multimeric flavodoxin WrbA